MTLVLGAVTLNRVESFSGINEVSYPRRKILGDTKGKIDDDAVTCNPKTWRIVARLSNSDYNTIDGYKDSYRTLADSDISFSETVKVESVKPEAIIPRDMANTNEAWRTEIMMVLSNS